MKVWVFLSHPFSSFLAIRVSFLVLQIVFFPIEPSIACGTGPSDGNYELRVMSSNTLKSLAFIASEVLLSSIKGPFNNVVLILVELNLFFVYKKSEVKIFSDQAWSLV